MLIILILLLNTRPRIEKKGSVKGCCCCQSLSCVRLFVTPCATACQGPLSSTTSWNLLKFLSIESMVLSNHLILCHPLLLLPSIFPSIQGLFQWVSSSRQVAKGSHFMLLFLTFSEDKSPPVIITNKGLFLDENSVKKITTLQLSAADQETEPTELVYRITREPQLGHLEHTASPGKPIISDFIRPKLGFSKCRGQPYHVYTFTSNLPLLVCISGITISGHCILPCIILRIQCTPLLTCWKLIW